MSSGSGRRRDPAAGATFRATVVRVLRVVGFHRAMAAMFALGVASIALNVIGPVLLGRATDLIFAGVVGRQFPDAEDKAEVVDRLVATGRDDLALVVRAVDFRPGQGVDLPAVGRILAVALLVYAVSGLCWILQGRQATAVVQLSAYRLRARVEEKLTRLPLSRLDENRRGDVLSRATNDIDNLVQTLQQTLSQLTNSIILIVALLGMMFWISPLLAVITLVVVPAAIALTTAIGKRAQPHFDNQWKATGDLSAYVEEVYSGHAVVRAFHQGERVTHDFRRHNEDVRRSGARAQVLSGAIQPSMNFVNNLGYVLVAVVGCLRVLAGGLSIGELQAFIIYSRQLSGPLTQTTSLAGVVQSGVASARRVFALLGEEEESDVEASAVPAGPTRGLVRFESVRFRYREDTPLIEDLSLTVEPGRTVAVVGPTGAGKTTLVNLLMRYYDVTAGRITLDGIDIRTVPRRELRSAVGLVLQDAWLFGGTIAENIGYGRDGATREEIERAAAAAHVDHLVRTLPDGYDSVIGDDSAGVSAGERQLITIARAFLADPPVLVLDEATSSVDTRTEVLVGQAMRRLSRGRTSFVIAHRLSTVRSADLIVVMDHGALVEQGTHDELLARGGAYRALYRAQFVQAGELVR